MTGFAKDVARELDKRQRRRRLTWLSVWGALIVAAVMYLRCGTGWGIGGSGDGSGTGAGSSAGAGSGSSASKSPIEKRCPVRVSADGITVDGKPATTDRIIKTCKGVDVIVTGDAREGAWKTLCDALDAAHVAIVMHSDAKVCPP